jgi:hypothetical protein
MSSSRKKVIVRRLVGDALPGYLPLSGFVRGPGQTVELLDLTGRIIEVPIGDIKMISYVRDFNLNDKINPERMARRTFLSRPRSEGLWVRMTFRTGEQLEGLAATDASLLDGLLEDNGIHIAPPDARSNTQHIFVPRSAIAEIQMLAVITTPSRIKPLPQPTQAELRKSLQEELFERPTPPNSRPN